MAHFPRRTSDRANQRTAARSTELPTRRAFGPALGAMHSPSSQETATLLYHVQRNLPARRRNGSASSALGYDARVGRAVHASSVRSGVAFRATRITTCALALSRPRCRAFVSYLLMDSTGNSDAAGVGETLQPRRDVNARFITECDNERPITRILNGVHAGRRCPKKYRGRCSIYPQRGNPHIQKGLTTQQGER